MNNCRDVIRFTSAIDTHSSDEVHRNRIEHRTVAIFDDSRMLIEDAEWGKYVSNVIQVNRKVSVLNTKTGKYDDRSETAIYISNFEISSQQAAKAIRRHWWIENRNHYVRDVTLGEDRSRIRVNPENMSTLRSFALNVMRRNHVENINEALYQNSLNHYGLYSYQQFI